MVVVKISKDVKASSIRDDVIQDIINLENNLKINLCVQCSRPTEFELYVISLKNNIALIRFEYSLQRVKEHKNLVDALKYGHHHLNKALCRQCADKYRKILKVL